MTLLAVSTWFYGSGCIALMAFATDAERSNIRFWLSIAIWPISVSAAVLWGIVATLRKAFGK